MSELAESLPEQPLPSPQSAPADDGLLSMADAVDVIAAAFWRRGTILDIDKLAELDRKTRPVFLAAKLMEVAQTDPQILEGIKVGKIIPTLKKEALSRV